MDADTVLQPGEGMHSTEYRCSLRSTYLHQDGIAIVCSLWLLVASSSGGRGSATDAVPSIASTPVLISLTSGG